MEEVDMSDRVVAVLSGGLSHEREVSIRSGRRLLTALRAEGLTVEEWDADANLLTKIQDQRPDAVVVALHGGQGENGSIQSVLELLRVPYVGTDSIACRQAWDKPSAKAVVAANGIKTPDWIVLPHSTFRELGAAPVLDAIVERLGLPLILKPDQGGSALGAQVVRAAADLPAAVVGSLAYGDTVLAERFIEGREVAITVIEGVDGNPEPVALPAVEIVPSGGVYDYTARYTAGLTDFHTPARLNPETEKRAGEVAVQIHKLLGLRDISRTDAIITDDGDVYFLEVNVSPGLTETSLLPMAVEASGHTLGRIYADLIERAVTR
jgi:D-alanine-D-alanine ligase